MVRRGPKFEYDVNISPVEHPITAGVTDFWHNRDELYHALRLNSEATNLRVLATSFSPPRMLRLKRTDKDGGEYVIDHCFGTGNHEPMVVITDYGRGRCFHMILGHYAESMTDNGFKTLMTRGVEWAATGEVTLPVIEPLPPAKRLPLYPQPQVVVEGLEQHLWHDEPDRLPELFAKDPAGMPQFAQQNAETIRQLIRDLRIPRVAWKLDGDRAVWALPEGKPGDRWWRIECVKQEMNGRSIGSISRDYSWQVGWMVPAVRRRQSHPCVSTLLLCRQIVLEPPTAGFIRLQQWCLHFTWPPPGLSGLEPWSSS